MNKIKAVFFDRDGTLIRDVSYLSDINHIEIYPQVIDICRAYIDHGYKLFVITNQSGVARGYFDEQFVEKTHQRLQELFAPYGISFEKFYYCPHHPTEAIDEKYKQVCLCRKPNPGMLLNAARDFDIDLTKSLMVGDSLCDIQAGQAAGCKTFNIQELFQQSHESFLKTLSW